MNRPQALEPLNNPSDFLEMGLQIIKSDKPQLAVALVDKVLARHGKAQPWAGIASIIMNETVPEFHGFMLRDFIRNRTYRRAIERFAKDRVVLDIGTGSGLLAMMAARAGAAHVYACEVNPILAASAQSVVDANDLSDKITIYAKHSAKLDALSDLGGGVDLVVSEIFSDSLLSEGVLPSLDHARNHLCRPDAVMLPDQASIMVGLADFHGEPAHPETVEGFDVSRFQRHMNTVEHSAASNTKLSLRSEPAELFRFNFNMKTPQAQTGQNELILERREGHVQGVAQWIRLQFAPDLTYENQPGGDAC
ncbi:MAG: 50S ribosomal protein L11 methyltransferase, partial [Pseudomonadota bacterium]